MVDIFGTLGPSCDDEEILYQMFKEGMTGIRINLSHVSLISCSDSLVRVKNAAKRCDIEPKILIDMQGPELRIGKVSGETKVTEGYVVLLYDKDAYGKINTSCKDNSQVGEYVGSHISKAGIEDTTGKIELDSAIFCYIKRGQEILLDDGKILLDVESVDGCSARAKVIRGGILREKKSIALVGESIEMPALTDEDKRNIRSAYSYGVTGVMQPFVRSAQDLVSLRKELDENNGSNIKIYAKIENMAGVENLSSFFSYADEIIIARGDLGNAMPLWELPGVQKEISQICNEHRMPFMVVTQMLSSMEHSKVPTRAEVSDIYNAVTDGAASVMVTGETAVGENPVDVIMYLRRTAEAALMSHGKRMKQ